MKKKNRHKSVYIMNQQGSNHSYLYLKGQSFSFVGFCLTLNQIPIDALKGFTI